jgi:hypothetical protein
MHGRTAGAFFFLLKEANAQVYRRLLIIFEITISGLEFGSIWLIWEKEKQNITFLCYIVLYVFPFSNVKIYATVHRWSNRPKPVKFKS